MVNASYLGLDFQVLNTYITVHAGACPISCADESDGLN